MERKMETKVAKIPSKIETDKNLVSNTGKAV